MTGASICSVVSVVGEERVGQCDEMWTGLEVARVQRRRLQNRYTLQSEVVLGIVLAGAIVSGWLVVLGASLFNYQWGLHSVLSAPIVLVTLCWLYVGLFIIAHDCMHGSLFPRKPGWNRVIGQLCLLLYAGFEFDTLRRQHFLHHRHSGTVDDPDFDARLPPCPLRWYRKFFTTYFSFRQVSYLFLVTLALILLGDAGLLNLLVFWALPSILSSLQLFYFGTYRPHCPSANPFTDRHHAHSSDYGWWASLFTCFHFGHHRAHHQHPYVPWWGLPSLNMR